MKTILTLAIMLASLAVRAENIPNSGNDGSDDRSMDKNSSAYLSDSLLDAFDEKRLDKGTGGDDSDFWLRLTVIRSFHAPLMFTWRMHPNGGESFLDVKRVQKQNSKAAPISYKKHDLWTRKRVSATQGRLLKSLFDASALMELPRKDWSLGSLDGSQWIYEVAASNDARLVVRSSPITAKADEFEALKVPTARIMQESKLNALGLMLWLLSEVDEEPY
jgi:hypothetical protein